jgi:hypothetical protein
MARMRKGAGGGKQCWKAGIMAASMVGTEALGFGRAYSYAKEAAPIGQGASNF